VRACKVERVIDGDTFVALADLGFRTYARLDVRLYGYDAPELIVVEGVSTKVRAEELLLRGGAVTIQGRGRSFARWVCEVWISGTPYAELMEPLHLIPWTPRRAQEVLTDGEPPRA
jgi:endonuclease YncB( thermonuclease family)